MTELFRSENGRRVFCGRCHHEMHQSRQEGGVFDSATGVTYYCEDCHAVYGVCRKCGWYMADGETCANCRPDRQKEREMLPEGINEKDLVKDPAGRAGHWLHEPTNTVYAMPWDWRPAADKADLTGKVGAKSTKAKDAADKADLTGKAVQVTKGRFEGVKGVISETGGAEDKFAIRVLLENGQEVPYDKVDEYVRFLSDEEIIADMEAKKEAEGK